MPRNPFGDDLPPSRPVNPFGDEGSRESADPADAAAAIEQAAARIRRIKGLVGAEGLTLSATRELLDQINAALEAVARALRGLER